jgi:cation:H+ antiporter
VDLVTLAVLGGSFVIILVGAELFTNGIEWVGRKLRLGEGVVGSVLAATGTALPETLIPIVAIGFGGAGERTDEIGVGAILGAPFMLSTLALAVTAVAVLYRARRRPARGDTVTLNGRVVGADLRYFFIAYTIALLSALLPQEWQPVRWLASAALVVVYVLYVRSHLGGAPANMDVELAPLRLGRLDPGSGAERTADPRMGIVVLQVAVALLAIVGGAVAFVGAVQKISLDLGVAPAVLALIIAPIATELPEKFNSIIWIRHGKDTLAIGNITGAMVFQSCLPVIVAILFAPHSWLLSEATLPTFASAGIAFVSTAVIFWPVWRGGTVTGRRLLLGGGFYLAYLIFILASLGRT